ncbi:hypothetical protein Dimus_012343 [Dionaea muscipula]
MATQKADVELESTQSQLKAGSGVHGRQCELEHYAEHEEKPTTATPYGACIATDPRRLTSRPRHCQKLGRKAEHSHGRSSIASSEAPSLRPGPRRARALASMAATTTTEGGACHLAGRRLRSSSTSRQSIGEGGAELLRAHRQSIEGRRARKDPMMATTEHELGITEPSSARDLLLSRNTRDQSSTLGELELSEWLTTRLSDGPSSWFMGSRARESTEHDEGHGSRSSGRTSRRRARVTMD